MAPLKQKTKENINNTNLPKQTVPIAEKSKKIQTPAESCAQSKPKAKSWIALSPAEKNGWVTQLFLTSGAWRNWPEGLQKEFLKIVEEDKKSPTTVSKEPEDLGRDRNGRLIADYSESELAGFKDKKRELAELKRESREFREWRFLARKLREKGEGNELEISEAEIEEERKRRRRMAILQEKREIDVGKYSGDPEWDDVVPLVQEESPGALASIAYTEEYAEAMSYLRAVMSTNEHTPRILTLTSHIISLNPAHYTVWLYRAQTLFALSADLSAELEWLNEIALSNQKNYQIWHHRQLIINHLYPLPKSTNNHEDAGSENTEGNEEWERKKEKLVKNEQAFMALMLNEDAKNYHVWSYRQWLIRHLNLFSPPSNDTSSPSSPYQTELNYTHNLLFLDFRNNSAYSHRFFLVFSNPFYCTPSLKPTQPDPKLKLSPGKEVVDSEIEWAKNWISSAPQNGSSWGYLRGALRKGGMGLGTLEEFAREFVQLGEEEGKEVVNSSFALEFLGDIWAGGDEGVDGGEGNDGKMDKVKADKAFRLLGEKYDVIRRNYWEWRRESLG